MKRRRLLIGSTGLVSLALGSACRDSGHDSRGSSVDTTSHSASRPSALGADSVLLAFESLALRLGHSRDSIARALGRPISVDVVEAEDMEGERDSLITIRYPGIQFHLHKPLADNREYFSNVIVSDSTITLPAGITPHRTTRVELRKLLGEPPRVIQFADSAAFTYDVPRGPILQFYFVGDLLQKVRWVYNPG